MWLRVPPYLSLLPNCIQLPLPWPVQPISSPPRIGVWPSEPDFPFQFSIHPCLIARQCAQSRRMVLKEKQHHTNVWHQIQQQSQAKNNTDLKPTNISGQSHYIISVVAALCHVHEKKPFRVAINNVHLLGAASLSSLGSSSAIKHNSLKVFSRVTPKICCMSPCDFTSFFLPNQKTWLANSIRPSRETHAWDIPYRSIGSYSHI